MRGCVIASVLVAVACGAGCENASVRTTCEWWVPEIHLLQSSIDLGFAEGTKLVAQPASHSHSDTDVKTQARGRRHTTVHSDVSNRTKLGPGNADPMPRSSLESSTVLASESWTGPDGHTDGHGTASLASTSAPSPALASSPGAERRHASSALPRPVVHLLEHSQASIRTLGSAVRDFPAAAHLASSLGVLVVVVLFTVLLVYMIRAAIPSDPRANSNLDYVHLRPQVFSASPPLHGNRVLVPGR